MNFEEEVKEKVIAFTGEKPVTFTTKSESTSENLAKIVAQNNWIIAGIQESENANAKRIAKLELQIQELRQTLEQVHFS